ncbi:transcription factor Opi1-domain-containing protein [Pseudomassariella vexata]|uniref:Transcription factor Opi1-domain-containing protein n=1 Tax=Pseudomassariella vexata TaxID=1141098 RepID=A0A1Y2EMW5_9PEZI|nr:transcription factor Opi1-domain-containing protein [Pseudomassariella vexata]ORY72175.1 transcription factor Opi1-domain-containing protein [Pseudomassariella vexata]
MLARPANRPATAAIAVADHKHSLLQQHEDRRQTPSSDIAAAFHTFDTPIKFPLDLKYPPPSYATAHHDHDHRGLVFPDAPKTELAPIHSFTGLQNDQKQTNFLPSLSALTASSAPLYPTSSYSHQPRQLYSHPPEPTYAPPPPPAAAVSPAPPQPQHWPSLNPLTAYYTPSHVQSADSPMRMDVDSNSNSGVSASSPERFSDGRASSVSLDDPDVRLAAEALGDLRADFVSSPPNRNTPLPGSPRSQSNALPPEPLLALLTTSHPVLGHAIEGTVSAYNASKNYSPRFKSSAEYVEGYVTPIANTVGSVGRVTGMEGGVRWFLGGGKRQKSGSSDLEAGDHTSNKRKRVEYGPVNDEQEDETMSGATTPRPSYDHCDRRLSVASTVDTLPAYDEFRSPAYTESDSRPTSSSAWQSCLMMSTSGLSIAMSEESLRSLKYCLSWLRWANVHIGNVINSLKTTMDRFERPQASADGDEPMRGVNHGEDARDRHEMAVRITALRADVLKTLQGVISTVSRYAGGALPENARILVRRHLTSLPQRFRVANMTGESQSTSDRGDLSAEEAGAAKEKEMREGVQRVLVLAKEGLDMMAQVSGVLDGTIVSAEEWCERLGRKKRAQREALLDGPPLPHVPLDDFKFG